jgi:hypothetical protein
MPILSLEVDTKDPSGFEDVLEVRDVEVDDHPVLRAESSTVSSATAAFLLHLRDGTVKESHCYFGRTQGNPIVYQLRYPLLGAGGHRSPYSRGLKEGRAGARAASHRPRLWSATVSVPYLSDAGEHSFN